MEKQINKILEPFNLSVKDLTPSEIKEIKKELERKAKGLTIIDGKLECIIHSKIIGIG